MIYYKTIKVQKELEAAGAASPPSASGTAAGAASGAPAGAASPPSASGASASGASASDLMIPGLVKRFQILEKELEAAKIEIKDLRADVDAMKAVTPKIQ